MVNFVDKYGLLHRYGGEPVSERAQTYVIIRKGCQIVCLLNETSQLYRFPSLDDVDLNSEPTLEFTVKAHIYELGDFVLERQTYRVYDVEEAQIEGTPLKWCEVDDVLVGTAPFDATQMDGLKNFWVRVK